MIFVSDFGFSTSTIAAFGRKFSISAPLALAASVTGSESIKNKPNHQSFPLTMAASVAVASSYTEIYVAVLSIIATKCAVVDPNATELVAACTKFKAGIVNLKTYVSGLDDILPVAADLSPLPMAPTKATVTTHQWPDEILRGYKLIKGGEKWPETSFEDDTLTQSFFSPLHRAQVDRVLEADEVAPGPIQLLLSLGFNTLAQTRAMRHQLQDHQYMSKWTLAACLIPQMTLLLLLGLQWIINRRRQSKLKKRIKKAEDAHQMIARIRGNHAWRDQSRFVEV